METTPRRGRFALKLLAGCVAAAAALGIAEASVRLLASPPVVLGKLGFETIDGTPIRDFTEGVRQGLIVPLQSEPPPPRQRAMFKPGLSFYITYTDNDVLGRSWLDEQGRCLNRINSAGIRDREELVAAKPKGQKRIVCVGDSFTFGWGIREEQNWVRMLEDALRTQGEDVRTVNCGAAGTVCVDEYVHGLVHRFARFDPDAVVLTLCLNDLIGSDGLLVLGPPVDSGSKLLDRILSASGSGPLALSPQRDWVDELMAMPETYPDGTPNPRFGPDKPYDAMWATGVPQKSLRKAKAWCEQRGIPFMVVMWPFLQGLGPGRHYPFQKIHDLVASDMAQAGVPFLDVTDALRPLPHEELWVTPADTHPNPLAQKVVTPLIAEFVKSKAGW